MIERRIALIAGLLVCAVLPAGCIPIPLGGNVGSSSQSASSSSAATTTPAATGPAKVGTSLTVGSWKVTVTSVRTSSSGPGGAKAASGKTFLLIETEFKNVLMRQPLTVKAKDAALTDFMGTKYAQVGKKNPGYNARGMRTIGAGLGGSTVFVYQIRKHTSGYTFTFSPKESGKRAKLQWKAR